MTRRRRVGMGLYFYPRGGSAQVVRYLSTALASEGWDTHLVTGSLGEGGRPTNAAVFFGHDDLTLADFTEAAEWHRAGKDAMDAPFPHHPSFEDRPGVPDRVFARVDASHAERQIDAWQKLIGTSRWSEVELIHLHHLTPLHAAAERAHPEKPRVTHLHGTELKFIEDALEARPDWPHAGEWVTRLREAAIGSAHFICISPHDRDLAVELLGMSEEKITIIPNGVDTTIFDKRDLTTDERITIWREFLVDQPLGWDESGKVGSIRYSEADLAAFESSPTLIYVGRFLAFKRVPLLIRAYARARRELGVRAPLVVWGGAPGEWEGEHPYAVAVREGVAAGAGERGAGERGAGERGAAGAGGVFFVGWRGHDQLPEGLAASDVMVAPSVDEPFGQVYLEAMAAGLPVIATSTGGPLSFVNTHPGEPNGWMVPPDDEEALAAAIAEAVDDPSERARRGDNAYRQIRSDFSWRSLARRYVKVYDEVVG